MRESWLLLDGSRPRHGVCKIIVELDIFFAWVSIRVPLQSLCVCEESMFFFQCGSPYLLVKLLVFVPYLPLKPCAVGRIPIVPLLMVFVHILVVILYPLFNVLPILIYYQKLKSV